MKVVLVHFDNIAVAIDTTVNNAMVRPPGSVLYVIELGCRQFFSVTGLSVAR
jgi:hypothetical protein